MASERAGNSDPLLLSAGELFRVVAGAIFQPHFLQNLRRLGIGMAASHALYLAWGQCDVLQNRQVWKQVVALKNNADLFAQHLQIDFLTVHLASADMEFAALDSFQAVDTVQGGGFAGTAASDEGDDLTALD